MKKYILSFITILSITLISEAVSTQENILGKIEDSLYGFQYTNESTATRLERIEKDIYGKTSTAAESQRIAKLSKDICANEIGNEIEPVEDTFAENPEYIAQEEMQETSDVSYPVIDEMEQEVFNKVYSNEKIKNRLAKLEEKTFHKTYTDDLSTRVDRLRAEIKPKSLMENRMAQTYNTFYDGDIEPADSSFHLDKYVPPNSFDYEAYNDMNRIRSNYYDNNYNDNNHYKQTSKKVSIGTIEKKLFKHSYNNEPTEKRLSRIEDSMFGTQFSSDDTQTRVDRVTSAYQAEKSAGKYDSNKFSQNMATAMQIGTILLMVLACIL